jgi:eukaryotic-like serine/threonine-protein kinase
VPSGWTWNVPPDAWLSLLLTILLFSTARRGNGWTGVHEWLSRTRVVERNVLRPVASAAPKASPADLVPALSSLRRVGPYAVHTLIGETGGGRLFVGVDPILRRHVWIHEVPAGTAAVEAIRRDVSRPGRLYWLAGRRSPTENWDAFEAPGGEPLLSARPTSDWRELHRSLSSLTIELDASVREEMDIRPTLAHVWKRVDGHLVLLDFPWPAPSRVEGPGLAASDANQHLGPVELLAAVSRHLVAPGMEPAAPLSSTTLLNRLSSEAPPALADVKGELLHLASIPSRPSRIRRALPIVLATMPVVVPILAVTVLLPNYVRSFQGELLMWMTWITESGADAEFKTPEQRTAAEQYVAAHFGSQLTSDEFWNTQAPQMEPFVDMRRRAAEIAARYPAVSPDELARASAIVAPQIQEVADWRKNFPAGGEALRGFVASGFASIPVLFSIAGSLISVLAVPGGLVTRALRHAVVRRDGREIGRVRSAVRLLIAWSPVIAWMAYVGNPMFGELRAMSPAAAYAVGGLALMSVAAGAVWTVAVPGRGPHDRIAGTWVVPR